uniref:Reverse transcriptase zinc-binding domain-containing protein n=1 Tax=Aegilops tauschii subsp. strangulata TaxID=200361 RepID=A0A453NP60_AEGTS
DHTPLLVDWGEATHVANKNAFSFELGWFEKQNFLEIIACEWAKPVSGRTSIKIWQNKIRHLRQFLRGWARNESGIYKQE